MLTAEHIDARRRGDELVLRRLDAADLRDAHDLAGELLAAAHASMGRSRAEVVEAWQAIETNAKKRRLAAGLRKLVEDACVFDEETGLDPVTVRRALFVHAAASRRSHDEGKAFDRGDVVREVAAEMTCAPEAIERSLFADLRGEHLLRSAPSSNAGSIVAAYELGRAQAVLLRAVRVRCEVKAGSPDAVRAFFAWLKFQRLLFTVERGGTSRAPEASHDAVAIGSGGFTIIIDGPFSMFESVTRYGLRLALLLPALRTLDAWSLVADIIWGKERSPLVFRTSSADDVSEASAAATAAPHLTDEVEALLDGLGALRQGPKARSTWRVEVANVLLDRPGLGVCIPDLVLTNEGDATCAPVYVEVLGFWSRDAVWKRVELAQQGLGARIVFCASARLRVSPEVLGDDAPAALYVYKGKPNARALLEHVERVASARS